MVDKKCYLSYYTIKDNKKGIKIVEIKSSSRNRANKPYLIGSLGRSKNMRYEPEGQTSPVHIA
jgi:hypothetical protein